MGKVVCKECKGTGIIMVYTNDKGQRIIVGCKDCNKEDKND